MNQMLPCPFCGATKITIEWESCPPLDKTDTNRRWFAECTGCSCQGPFCQKETEVVPAWNKRIALHQESLERWMREATDLLCYQPEIPMDHKTALVDAFAQYRKAIGRPLRDTPITNPASASAQTEL